MNQIVGKSVKQYYSQKAMESIVRKAIRDHCYLSVSKQPYNEEEEEELISKWMKNNL